MRFEGRRVRWFFAGLDAISAEKFGPSWEDRYLVEPTTAALPEVVVALVRAHVPPLWSATAWLRGGLPGQARRDVGRNAIA
jgi:lysylphosphatidylglycerol synthetase-like protein (DUF2156 family)